MRGHAGLKPTKEKGSISRIRRRNGNPPDSGEPLNFKRLRGDIHFSIARFNEGLPVKLNIGNDSQRAAALIFYVCFHPSP